MHHCCSVHVRVHTCTCIHTVYALQMNGLLTNTFSFKCVGLGRQKYKVHLILLQSETELVYTIIIMTHGKLRQGNCIHQKHSVEKLNCFGRVDVTKTHTELHVHVYTKTAHACPKCNHGTMYNRGTGTCTPTYIFFHGKCTCTCVLYIHIH